MNQLPNTNYEIRTTKHLVITWIILPNTNYDIPTTEYLVKCLDDIVGLVLLGGQYQTNHLKKKML